LRVAINTNARTMHRFAKAIEAMRTGMVGGREIA
jgi:hypothetical protein